MIQKFSLFWTRLVTSYIGALIGLINKSKKKKMDLA